MPTTSGTLLNKLSVVLENVSFSSMASILDSGWHKLIRLVDKTGGAVELFSRPPSIYSRSGAAAKMVPFPV